MLPVVAPVMVGKFEALLEPAAVQEGPVGG